MSNIAEDTRIMYGLLYDSSMHNENTPGRIPKDAKNEESIRETLRSFNVFSCNGNTLQNIATKDIATPSIEQSLLNATTLGKQKLKTFVQERLVTATADTGHEVERKKFNSSMHRNNPPIFATLYEVKQHSKARK